MQFPLAYLSSIITSVPLPHNEEKGGLLFRRKFGNYLKICHWWMRMKRTTRVMIPGLGECGGPACWNRNHGGRRWLPCYQLSVSAFSCPADLLNQPVSVLMVTRQHVLHSWGLLAEENHHQVKRKEQGAPPTAEYSCTRLQYLNTHA